MADALRKVTVRVERLPAVARATNRPANRNRQPDGFLVADRLGGGVASKVCVYGGGAVVVVGCAVWCGHGAGYM